MAILGNPGRYMSMENGLTVARDPRIRIM